jgi:hypothetical protein
MQWYYLSDSYERIPVSEAQFAALAARGVVRPATPVWRKGMVDWTACGEVKPEIFAAGVTRVSDERHPIADHMAVHGAVIGLSRALAGYHSWMRVLGVGLLALGACLVGLLAWESWLLVRHGFDAWSHGIPLFDPLKEYAWLPWILMSLDAVVAGLIFWSGGLLLRGAGKARRAMDSGSEQVLASAIQDVGRYFLVTAVMIVFSVVCWLGLLLWLGRDKAFPPPEPPAGQRITV